MKNLKILDLTKIFNNKLDLIKYRIYKLQNKLNKIFKIPNKFYKIILINNKTNFLTNQINNRFNIKLKQKILSNI